LRHFQYTTVLKFGREGQQFLPHNARGKLVGYSHLLAFKKHAVFVIHWLKTYFLRIKNKEVSEVLAASFQTSPLT
jgi:hypothetical protein